MPTTRETEIVESATANRAAVHGAERALLGALLLSATSQQTVLSCVQAEHFGWEPHRQIYQSIRRLYERQAPIDPITVHHDLRAQGHLTFGDKSAGILLHDCLQASYLPENATWYAAIVLEAALHRRATQAGQRIGQLAERGLGKVSDLLVLIQRETHQVHQIAQHLHELTARTKTLNRVPSRHNEIADIDAR
jgi:replicative DNA helicase